MHELWTEMHGANGRILHVTACSAKHETQCMQGRPRGIPWASFGAWRLLMILPQGFSVALSSNPETKGRIFAFVALSRDPKP